MKKIAGNCSTDYRSDLCEMDYIFPESGKIRWNMNFRYSEVKV